MEKPRPEPARTPPPASQLDVVVQRCPFCRERLGGPDGDAVSCAACNARHHTACWDEHAACASCGHTARLVPERSAPERHTPESRAPRPGPSWAAFAGWLLAGGLAALALAGALLYGKLRQEARLAPSPTASVAMPQPRRIQPLGVQLAATVDGLQVEEVLPEGRAARAGLRPGDLLLELIVSDVDAFDVRHTLRRSEQLSDLLDELGPHALLSLQLRRDGVEQRVRLP